MQTKRILGIDPGSRYAGVGIIDFCDAKRAVSYVYADTIALKQECMGSRLAALHARVSELVVQHAPDEVAIERVFSHINVESAIKLAQARGVAIAAAVASGICLFEYSPKEIKQSVVGKGQADKTQIQKMVKVLLNVPGRLGADAADALAVALTHAYCATDRPKKQMRDRRSRGLHWSEDDIKLKRDLNRS